jgi:membrane-bound ClpP family serine protease
MEWSIVISLIVFGLALIVAEIVFVPGTTVVGFLGFALVVVGLIISFRYFGHETAWVIVGITTVASGLVFYFSFKANVWGRFALKSSAKSKVNEGELEGLASGQEGTAISALRPVGKGELGNKIYEVRTQGSYVESGAKIRVVKILFNQIIVEPTP